jgi:hypothetical protein
MCLRLSMLQAHAKVHTHVPASEQVREMAYRFSHGSMRRRKPECIHTCLRLSK